MYAGSFSPIVDWSEVTDAATVAQTVINRAAELIDDAAVCAALDGSVIGAPLCQGLQTC